MSRNLDREHAFEYMYSLLFEKADDKTNELILDNTPQNECQQGEEPDEFFSTFCKLAKENLSSLEIKLAQNLNKNVPASSLFAIDRAIILSAFIFIDYMKEDAPLVISESVRIAKKYSTDNSPKFINGFLSSVYGKSVGEENA